MPTPARLKLLARLLLLLIALSVPVSYAAQTLRSNVFLEMMLAMMDFMDLIDRDRDYERLPYPNYNTFLPTMPYSSAGLGGQNPWQSYLQAMALQQMFNSAYPGMFPGTIPGLGSGFGSGMPGGINPFGVTSPWSLGGFGGPVDSFGNWNPLANQDQGHAIVPFLPEFFAEQGLTPPKPKTHWIEGRWVAGDNMIMEVERGRFVMYYRDRPEQKRDGLIRIKDRWLAIAIQSHKITRQYEYAYKDDLLVLKDSDGNMMLFKRLHDWPLALQ